MRLENPRELSKRLTFSGIGKHDLADEPVETRGAERESFGTRLNDDEAALLTGREGLTIEVDTGDPASSFRSLLKLSALAAIYIQYAGVDGDI